MKTKKSPRWSGLIQLGCLLLIAGIIWIGFCEVSQVKYAVTILAFVLALFFLVKPSDKQSDSDIDAAKNRLDNAQSESEKVIARRDLERLLK